MNESDSARLVEYRRLLALGRKIIVNLNMRKKKKGRKGGY